LIHRHYFFYCGFNILFKIIYTLFDISCSRRIYITSRNVGVNLQVLTLLSELQHSERSKIINLKCLLDWVVKVNRRCAIDNYVTVINKHFSMGIRHAQVFDNQITHYRYNLTLCPGIEVFVFYIILLLHNRKHITIQNFIFYSVEWFFVSFWANHYVKLIYTWARSH
jgi:hypothetical protein